MPCDPTPTLAMLPNPQKLRTAGPLSFARARALADQAASRTLPAPLLLAWFNRQTGEFSPHIPCCQEELPSWLVYARSRAAELSVTINDELFVFVYRRGV